uniref:SprT-like domain-containing protein n=1 Tax=Lygus hesperus TaxID=30085 RepID=A0A0K8SMS5_LYGHE
MFNEFVFDFKLPEDMQLEWSGRMTSSAGITHLSRKMVGGEWQFISRITLSKPIVTTAARLRDTLIHEMCHAAVWLLDRKKDGHGSYWKAWTYKAREAFPELLPINTCHSYSRDWKFTWECISCGYTIGRMTKSFNTERFSCGRCHGRFELKENKNKTKREANGFARYVKENYASVKSDKRLQHKEVMKMLSQQYKDKKNDKNRSLKEPDDGIELISIGGDDYDNDA